MKQAIILSISFGALIASGALHAQESQLPNAYVGAALQSLIDAEKTTYDKYVVKRSKAHGCTIAKNMTELKTNDKAIPSIADFQGIVGIAASALDNGKYAAYLDPAALKTRPGAMSAKDAADLLHAYADISRTNYTASVVARAHKSGCSKSSEQWAEDKGLPLPAQFTRMTAAAVSKAGKFTYSLQSEWPINKQNAAKTPFEKEGIKITLLGKNHYGTEILGGKKYFSAAYPDVATNAACTGCHNEHGDSPKKDFKLMDVMGDMVVRIPLNN